MPGLVDSKTGLVYGSGLIWLPGGLGAPDLDNPPSTTITTSAGVIITTDAFVEITTG